MPSLAKILGFATSMTAYWALSLLISFLLVLMVVRFLDHKIKDDAFLHGACVRWLSYLAVLSCSFVANQFQWPGNPEQLAYCFILLMATSRMNAASRLSLVALSLLTHDGIGLILLPTIIFFFPKRERWRAAGLVVLFYVVGVLGVGFGIENTLANHHVIGSMAKRTFLLREPLPFILGLLFSFKLLWLLPLPVALRWWKEDRWGVSGSLVILLCSGSVVLIAWDLTRLAGFMFLPFLFFTVQALCLPISKRARWAVITILLSNLIIPSSLVYLHHPATFYGKTTNGGYQWIDSLWRTYVFPQTEHLPTGARRLTGISN